MGKNVKRIQLTVLVVFILQDNSSGFLQTPTVPAVTSCLHYHFEEGHLVSQKKGNCCFASDLLNSLGSSVTAAAYSHRKARKLVRGGSGY